ncbi:MAG: hypothetical protein LBV18_04970 [Alistipes sp.]|jgi:hypothetical protein|nr:hypothetical protein [Alistipes sp.]
MKKIAILLTLAATVAVVFGAQGQRRAQRRADEATAAWKYEIEYARTGGNNMLLVKVWSYAEKPEIATSQATKNAVHGVLFKGYTSSGAGTISQRPLVQEPDAATRHQAFFDEFFGEGGDYMKYVSATVDGSTSVVKVGKKEYKAGVVVTVNKDLLRSDLEAAGIIRGLGSGF